MRRLPGSDPRGVSQNHMEECRQRIETAMLEDEANKDRAKRAVDRQVERRNKEV